MRRILLSLNALLSTSAGAYTVASPNASHLNPALPTRVIVSGYGGALQNAFVVSSASRAKHYREVFPNSQILVITAHERGNEATDLRNMGLRILDANDKPLSSRNFVAWLKMFSRLESLDIYSHGARHLGMGLQDGKERFMPKTWGVGSLRSRFAPGAFVFLHGCNTGWEAAPEFSRIWGIPVAGSLTSTDFQQLHSNGQWYHHNPGQFPPGGWKPCAYGSCWRMKPDNLNYVGYYGKYDNGLGFYKFFCDWKELGDPAAQDRCYRGMATALRAFGTGSLHALLVDFLCPNSPTSNIRGECAAALEAGLRTGNEVYSPFQGRPLNCDMKGCEDAGGVPTTIIQEYKRYLRGLQLLRQTH